MNRIMIIGCGGSGKSTLARKINRTLGLKLIHMDQYFWSPGWVEPDAEQWQAQVQALADTEQWILDGNYGGTMDIRLERADTIIFLNFSSWTCLRRVLWRNMRYYGRSRPDMTEDCPERFSWFFMKYIWHYNTTRRPGILKKLSLLEKEKKVFVLSNDQEVSIFLRKIASSS